MATSSPPSRTDGQVMDTRNPPLAEIEAVFSVSEVRRENDEIHYVGNPQITPEQVAQEVWDVFRDHGYDPYLATRNEEYVLIAEPVTTGLDGIPWTNVILVFATILSTLFAGSMWYHVDPISNPTAIWQAWPFTVAILTVLGFHEMGHYLASRYHGVDASLPYFIPVPTLIGTMGAVIKMRGRIPTRKALFDIGVSGPLAGLVATVGVTVVGLHLQPVTASETLLHDPNTVRLELGYPPLLELLAQATGQPLYRADPSLAVNPVVIGGWVGMFVTFLNLIPVGQLDGGHILRSMIGSHQRWLSTLVPGALLGLGVYLYYVGGYDGTSVFIWFFWGLFSMVLAVAGSATPVWNDRLGAGRMLLGLVTFALGLLCFMPVPLAMV